MDGGWQVHGVLSIGGADCPLVLQVRRGGENYDGFVATTTVSKRALGVHAPNLLIRDAVHLSITTRLP